MNWTHTTLVQGEDLDPLIGHFPLLGRSVEGPALRRQCLKGLVGMAAGGESTMSSCKMELKVSHFNLLMWGYSRASTRVQLHTFPLAMAMSCECVTNWQMNLCFLSSAKVTCYGNVITSQFEEKQGQNDNAQNNWQKFASTPQASSAALEEWSNIVVNCSYKSGFTGIDGYVFPTKFSCSINDVT